jgi:glucose-1-phosphate cytidylyltransferase
MKVAIFAGGRGTRLHAESAALPKALFQVGERPIVWHIMRSFASAGFQEFVLLLGYKREAVVNYFVHEAPYYEGDVQVGVPVGGTGHVEITPLAPAQHRWSVTLCDTTQDAGKGERLLIARRYLEDDCFFATYGDGLSDIDLRALLEFHKSHGKIATLTAVQARSQFGHVVVGDASQVQVLREKPPLPDLINGGFFVFDRKVFDYLRPGDQLETDCLPRLAAEGQLMAYRHDGFWACLDTYKDSLELNDLWEKGNPPWMR